MFLSARTSLQMVAAATLAGVLALTAYGWKTLDDASAEAASMTLQVLRLSRIQEVEEELHELAARSPTASVASLERSLSALHAMEHPTGELPILAELDLRVSEARAVPSPESWSRAAEAISELGKLEVERAIRSADETSRPARSGARSILKLCAAVVLVGGVLSVLAFVRLRRERRAAESRLRRSDRLAVLGTMAASVAHELNNPLATISGCATAVRDRLRKSAVDGADAHADEIEYLDMVVDETRRCSGIVRSLRDLARDTPPAMAPSDLAALVREVVQLVEMSRAGPAVALEVRGEPALEIVCDTDKVKQLLLNLLVNARDACGEGGRVRVTVSRDAAGGARLEVQDDGRGIEPDDLSRIFEPFHTGKTRGLGLGLFVCERIASLHGGTISAESAGPGRGARFTVTLPERPPGRAARPGTGAAEPAFA